MRKLMDKAFKHKEAKDLIEYYKSVLESIYDAIDFCKKCEYNIEENRPYDDQRFNRRKLYTDLPFSFK